MVDLNGPDLDPTPDDETNNDLLRLLLEGYRSGIFTVKDLVPAADVLLPKDAESQSSLITLYDALKDRHEPELMALCETMRKRLVHECFLAHGVLKTTGNVPKEAYFADLPRRVPTGWSNQPTWPKLFYSLFPLMSDVAFALKQHRVEGLLDCVLPELIASLESIPNHPDAVEFLGRLAGTADLDEAIEAVNRLPEPVDASLPDASVLQAVQLLFKEAPDAVEHRLLLGQLCVHPSPAAVEELIKRTVSPDDQLFVSRLLMLRFGYVRKTSWDDWRRWLQSEHEAFIKSQKNLDEHLGPNRLYIEVLKEILATPDNLVEVMKTHADGLAAQTSNQAFIQKWRVVLSGQQCRQLLYAGDPDGILETEELTLKPRPPDLPVAEEAAWTEPEEAAWTEPEEAAWTEPEPSVWNDHIRPMLAENTYVTAGIAMVLVGTALLAYFTWDKHWVFRYSIMPLLTGVITFGFAEMGIWLERRSTQMREMGILLRGGAIALVPFNFMALCLLGSDAAVQNLPFPLRNGIVGFMGGIYLVVYSMGLLRWCKSVLPELKWYLGWTCILINIHVVVGAVVLVNNIELTHAALLVLCHTALGVVAVGTYRFAVGLPRAVVNDRWVTGFYGGAVAACFAESLIGLHIFYKSTPAPYEFTFLLILSGGLILFSESRLFPSPDSKPREESFMGFALIAAGLLAGMGHDMVRVCAFVVAGVVWLLQARGTLARIHTWIGLTLIALGLGAVGALNQFPIAASWNPAGWLGITIILLMVVLADIARKAGKEDLAWVSRQIQTVLTVITTGVAVLVQWRYQEASTPLYTAVVLIFCSAVMIRQAITENSPRFMQSAIAIVVVALPYLGCVNMRQPRLTGNVMVFGLAVTGILWLACCRIFKSELIKYSRSGVLWGLGTLAMSAMILRVLFEGNLQAPNMGYRFMDEVGPLLMAGVLITATWYSRSLVPAAMASFILAVLFPELKASYRETAEVLGYGSGLGSSVSALILVLVCGPLRKWSRLRMIPEGDSYLGVHPFPLLRHDASLFTLPLGVTALFLIIKVCTWNHLRQIWQAMPATIDGLDDLLLVKLGFKAAFSLAVAGVAWFAVSLQYRDKDWSKLGIHAAWLALLVGLHWIAVELGISSQYAISGTILAVVLTVGWCKKISEKYDYLNDSVIVPYGKVLSVVGPVGTAVICLDIFLRSGVTGVWSLIPLILAINLYFGWKHRGQLYGYAALILVATVYLSLVKRGSRILPVDNSITIPFLVLILSFSLLLIAREWIKRDRLFEDTAWLATPARILSDIFLWLVNLFWLGSFIGGNTAANFGDAGLAMLVVAQLLVMRSSGSLLISLWLCVIGHGILAEVFPMGRTFEAFLSPWRLGLLALTMALMIPVVRTGLDRYPRLFLARGVKLHAARTKHYTFHVVIGLLCLLAGFMQLLFLIFDPSWPVLLGCYFSAAALLLLYWSWPGKAFAIFSIIFEVAASVAVAFHTFFHAYNEQLRSMGITVFHALAFGLALASLQVIFRTMAMNAVATRSTSSLRQLPQDLWASYVVVAMDRLRHDRFWLSWLWGGAVRILLTAAMVFLTLNYLVNSGIQEVSWLRYIVSGSLALFIALYFRDRARAAKNGGQFDVAMYHYSVTMALWCVLLLIPVMSEPSMAFLTFSFAPLFFWLQSERHRRKHPEIAAQYGTSALVFIVVLYVLYLYTPWFDSLVYKGVPLTTGRFATHYHSNSPVILLLSILAIRLHALTGKWWSPFYGGIVGIVMTLFIVTWIRYPLLSPFENPMNSAWVVIPFAHVWLLLINRPTPIRAMIQALTGFGEERMARLTRVWSACISAVAMIAVVYGTCSYGDRPKEVALLLLVVTTVFLHHAYFERGFAAVLGGLSGILVLLAIHMDFLIPSYLPQNYIILVLVALWFGALSIHSTYGKFIPDRIVSYFGQLMGALLLIQIVVVHHPETTAGLIGFAAMACLAAVTPMPSLERNTSPGLVLLIAPLWLAFFSQSRISEAGVNALTDLWPYLAMGTAALGVAILAREYYQRQASRMLQQCRLYHGALAELNTNGLTISASFLTILILVLGYALLTILGWRELSSVREVTLTALLFPIAAHAWYRLGRARKSVVCIVIAEVNLVGMALTLRQILWLAGSWNVYYDVWTAISLSFLLTALKQVWDTRPQEERKPAYWTIWMLPVLTLAWALFKNLNTDIILLIVALHSLMFAYLGGSRRESPYHAIAVCGFVSFMLILLTRLEFRAVNAYIIPIGLGGLVLLQLFRDKMDVPVRNRIRTACLLAMIGSSTWYALIGKGYPVSFNLTLIVICILAMLLGNFLRIRIYVLLGFTGLMVDLMSLLYKGVRRLDRNYQMASIGALLLLVGVAVVAGAAWCRVNRERLQLWTARMRDILGGWE